MTGRGEYHGGIIFNNTNVMSHTLRATIGTLHGIMFTRGSIVFNVASSSFLSSQQKFSTLIAAEVGLLRWRLEKLLMWTLKWSGQPWPARVPGETRINMDFDTTPRLLRLLLARYGGHKVMLRSYHFRILDPVHEIHQIYADQHVRPGHQIHFLSEKS